MVLVEFDDSRRLLATAQVVDSGCPPLSEFAARNAASRSEAGYYDTQLRASTVAPRNGQPES